jgi:hypothetical protein
MSKTLVRIMTFLMVPTLFADPSIAFSLAEASTLQGHSNGLDAALECNALAPLRTFWRNVRGRGAFSILHLADELARKTSIQLSPSGRGVEFQVFTPKETALREIASLGGKVPGARWIPTVYLEDTLVIMRRFTLRDKKALDGITVGMSWKMLIPFTIMGMGGFYRVGANRLTTTLFQSRAAFQWVFSHELTHAVMDRRPDTFQKLRALSWAPVNESSLSQRIVLVAEFLISGYIAVHLLYGWFAGFGMGAGLSIVLLAFGMLGGIYFSFVTGSLVRTLMNPGDAHIFDSRKPWSLLTFYSLVSADEEAADLGATMMVFPHELDEKVKHNPELAAKVAILREDLFDNQTFTEPQNEQLKANAFLWGWPSITVSALLLYAGLWASLLFGHLPAVPSSVIRAFLYYETTTAILLGGFRPILALRIHLAGWAHHLPPAIKRMIRSAVVAPFTILLEIQKLAIAALLILMFMLASNPQAISYKPFASIPVREFARQLREQPTPTPSAASDYAESLKFYWNDFKQSFREIPAEIKDALRPAPKTNPFANVNVTPLAAPPQGQRNIVAPSRAFLQNLARSSKSTTGAVQNIQISWPDKYDYHLDPNRNKNYIAAYPGNIWHGVDPYEHIDPPLNIIIGIETALVLSDEGISLRGADKIILHFKNADAYDIGVNFELNSKLRIYSPGESGIYHINPESKDIEVPIPKERASDIAAIHVYSYIDPISKPPENWFRFSVGYMQIFNRQTPAATPQEAANQALTFNWLQDYDYYGGGLALTFRADAASPQGRIGDYGGPTPFSRRREDLAPLRIGDTAVLVDNDLHLSPQALTNYDRIDIQLEDSDPGTILVDLRSGSVRSRLNVVQIQETFQQRGPKVISIKVTPDFINRMQNRVESIELDFGKESLGEPDAAVPAIHLNDVPVRVAIKNLTFVLKTGKPQSQPAATLPQPTSVITLYPTNFRAPVVNQAGIVDASPIPYADIHFYLDPIEVSNIENITVFIGSGQIVPTLDTPWYSRLIKPREVPSMLDVSDGTQTGGFPLYISLQPYRTYTFTSPSFYFRDGREIIGHVTSLELMSPPTSNGYVFIPNRDEVRLQIRLKTPILLPPQPPQNSSQPEKPAALQPKGPAKTNQPTPGLKGSA